jgi:cytoskeletal protein CcmA (bactofilin family)
MKRDRNTEAANYQNIIAKKTQITGDFNSVGDIRIDGELKGNIKSTGKVVVGKDGKIEGTLDCENAHFEGFFSGEMKISGTLTLKKSAIIEGTVVTEKLAVEPGAEFNVTCTMKSSVKDLNSDKKTKKTA